MNAIKITITSLLLASASSAFALSAGPGVEDKWIRETSPSTQAPMPTSASAPVKEISNVSQYAA